jgi:hypothetical protein
MKIIHDYHDKPCVTEFFDDAGHLEPLEGNGHIPIYGIELEVENTRLHPTRWQNRHSNELLASRVMGTNPNLRCHYDSSLYNGFEITATPGTLGYYTNVFDWSFLDVIRNHKSAKIDGIGEKGFHIHINKSSFKDEEHMVRFAEAITTEVLNGSYMFLVSTYCKAEVSRCFDPEIYGYCSRYVSVNLQNMRTVEVRCFIPTTDKHEVINYIKYLGLMQGETK